MNSTKDVTLGCKAEKIRDKSVIHLNPQASVAQKIADGVVFRRFQGEGVEFFLNRTSLTPLRFSMRIFLKIPI